MGAFAFSFGYLLKAIYYYCLENLNIFVEYLYHKHVVI